MPTAVRYRHSLWLASLACALTSSLSAQTASGLRFVTLLGRDTIAVEEARVLNDSLRGVVLVQEPELTRYEYSIKWSAAGGLTAATITASTLGEAGWVVRRNVSLRSIGDSVALSIQPEGVQRTVLAAEAQLSLPGSGALVWMAVRRFDRLGVDSAALPWLAPLGGPGGRFIVRRRGAGVLEYRLSGGFSVLRRGTDGTIAEIDARATTLKIQVLPASAGAMEAVQSSWSGLRSGPLSPRDTLRARVGCVDLIVDYGKPAVRGRDVFGDGVLGDSVWRTGANAATQLELSGPLEFSSGVLPAGKYTLFTRIRPGGSELLINGQQGIWGTQYRADRDVLRVPMLRQRAAFQERLDIRVESVAPALVIHWADAAFRVPFRMPPRC